MKYLLATLLLLFIITAFAQQKYMLSVEEIVLKSSKLVERQNGRFYSIAGCSKQLLVYQLTGSVILKEDDGETISKLYYDEKSKTISDSFDLRTRGRKIRRVKQQNELTISQGYFYLPDSLAKKSMRSLSVNQFSDFQDFWINNTSTKPLASYQYNVYDRDIDYYIEPSGKYIAITSFVPEYLRSTEADSVISVWDFSKGVSAVSEVKLNCIECIRPQIVGNFIYYGKKFFPLYGADAYDWKLFRAPLFDLSKSEMIGDFFELLQISPDGKYALGKKSLMREDALAIIDIETKKLQYLLGRKYYHLNLFYSPAYRKFAFDSPNHIVYLNFPNEYPFNAIGPSAKPVDVSNEQSEKFWKGFVHKPLE